MLTLFQVTESACACSYACAFGGRLAPSSAAKKKSSYAQLEKSTLFFAVTAKRISKCSYRNHGHFGCENITKRARRGSDLRQLDLHPALLPGGRAGGHGGDLRPRRRRRSVLVPFHVWYRLYQHIILVPPDDAHKIYQETLGNYENP